MASSASNTSSPRRPSNSPSTRRASAGPRSLSSSYTSSSHAQVEYPFGSAATIQIDRTVSVTIEVLSGSALASHVDVSQYHMPVTTSCYSPTTSTTYEYAATASEHGTSTSYSSQGAYPLTPSTTEGSLSSHHGQSSANGKQGSLGYPYGSSEHHFSSSSLYQQQNGQYSPAFEGWLLVLDILMQAR